VPRDTGGSRPTEPAAGSTEAWTAPSASSAAEEAAVPPEAGGVTELPAFTAQVPRPKGGDSAASPRFQIFIIDTGWNSPARKVLHENFAFLSDLQRGDPIYVLDKQKSLAFLRHHPSLMGKGPVIAVHDLNVLRESGTGGFHGFRLHLGLMRSEQQALLALQTFARFLVTHRRSVDLEVEIRRDLRREGIIGAIEIILHHEPRDIGG
jgi:hypothetical protein